MDIKFENLPTLNKTYILSRVTQEQIFEEYTKISISSALVRSPLRPDKNPGCKFYYKNNK